MRRFRPIENASASAIAIAPSGRVDSTPFPVSLAQEATSALVAKAKKAVLEEGRFLTNDEPPPPQSAPIPTKHGTGGDSAFLWSDAVWRGSQLPNAGTASHAVTR